MVRKRPQLVVSEAVSAPRERMLHLLSLLQSGRRWPASELATAMQATSRTLRRDIEQLRRMGYPVESVRGPGGHYRLVAGNALPPLMLDDDEAVVAVLGLRLAAAGQTGIGDQNDAADRALAKLRRILPAPLRRRADEVVAAVDLERTEHPQPSPETFRILAGAIATRRRLVFEYTGRESSSRRRVEPARLVRLRQRWYLFAWDLDRQDWRTFRLDRMADPQPAHDMFAPRPLPAEDLASHLQARFRDATTTRVVLRLEMDARDAASRLYRVDGTLHPLGPERCRYVAHVDSYEWLATVLIVSEIEFVIEEPAEFAGYLSRAAQRLLRGCEPHPGERDGRPAGRIGS